MDPIVKISADWIPIDQLDYRSMHVDFYEDCLGHQIFGILNNSLVEFGVYNTMYKDDAQLLIDDLLDTITRFGDHPEWFGSKLVRFQNGGYTDVKLVYRGRILKVYPQAGNEDETILISDAVDFMHAHPFLLN